ncbi:MAG: hypothetical protein CMJ31_03445 [Phycisphaerae bacterium]|nr:hypothetical protein [Phycisphaerae bacterium]
MKKTLAFVALAGLSAAAWAGNTTITFDEGLVGAGEQITDQYAGLGVLFSGDLVDLINVIDHPLEQPVAGDLGGFGGFGDGDGDLQAAGLGFGAVTSTIRIDVAEPGTYLTDVSLEVVRRRDQTLHLAVGLRNGDTLTFDLPAPGFGSGIELLFPFQSFGLSNPSLQITSIELSNGGGTFGINDFSFTAAVPLPSGAALACAGLGLVATRRRRA